MQQIIQDPTKSALIQAVAATLAGTPQAGQAVVKLSLVLPVYLNAIADMQKAVDDFVGYMQGGSMPEWYKHASQQ